MVPIGHDPSILQNWSTTRVPPQGGLFKLSQARDLVSFVRCPAHQDARIIPVRSHGSMHLLVLVQEARLADSYNIWGGKRARRKDSDLVPTN